MARKRHNLWLRPINVFNDCRSDQASLCQYPACRNPATHVIGWDNPRSARFRYGSSLRCARHAREWFEQHIGALSDTTFPELPETVSVDRRKP